MNYIEFYSNILQENTETGISSDNTIELNERGYVFLKNTIDKLNKKASSWKVPSIELKVISENFIKKTLFINKITGEDQSNQAFDSDIHTKEDVIIKKYKVEVHGEPPQVHGYKFVARIEHTEAGNIINFAPNVSSTDVPDSYRNANQACDVCKENRERNNTFILRLTQDDKERFPDKKSGDFIMVGSACLKRFLPNITSSTLIYYAKVMETLRNIISVSEEMRDTEGEMMSRNSYSNYIEISVVLFWLSAAYLYRGKYVSQTSATTYGESSTSSDAVEAMYYRPSQASEKNDIIEKLKDASFKQQCKTLSKNIHSWMKTFNFASAAVSHPKYESLFKNLEVISKLDVTRKSNLNYLGALLGIYLHETGQIQKQAQAQVQSDYLGKVGEKITLTVEVKKVKEFQNQFSYYGGTSYLISMIGEENTTSGIKKGNITYFSSNPILDEGDKAIITATVKNQQISKYTNKPETIITRGKVVKMISRKADENPQQSQGN